MYTKPKIIIILFISTIVIATGLFLYLFVRTVDPITPALQVHPIYDLDGIRMIVTDVTTRRRRTVVQITIINETAYTLVYGHFFVLEYFDGENWRFASPARTRERVMVTAEALTLMPKSYSQSNVNLASYALRRGRVYRIRRGIGIDNTREHELAAEFRR